MNMQNTTSQFSAQLLQPRAGGDDVWAFIVLPLDVSAKLPRRGRTTVFGTLNGVAFEALLEPDGQKSHWLKVDEALLRASNLQFGDEAHFEIAPVEQEPEPRLPADLALALEAADEAMATWLATTTLARLDWIHWIESAKRATTRSKRVHDAVEMLASGKKRVCCFDPSGFYSKALSAPSAVE